MSAAGAGAEAPLSARRATIERWIPGIRAMRTYQPSWLPRDLIAGVVLVTLLVPQGMAYAELAGLPAIHGLYTTVVCLIAYALVGPSPVLVLGPDSSLGPMIAATILPLAAGDPDSAVALAGALALLVGAITLGAGLARLGFVADLLSNPVRTGYLAGLAVVIFVGQLPKLFGFSTDADGLINEARAFVEGLDMTNQYALVVGAISLAVILLLKRFAPRMPGIFVAVVAAIFISIVLDLASKGVSVVGPLPQGFPVPTLPRDVFRELPELFIAALGISLVSIGDTISTSGGFARKTDYEVDGNQELAGIGAANLAAGVFSGFPVSTSSSRTAVAFQSGSKTQLTGLVAALLVIGMLLFVPGLVKDMPQPVLAAVVISAAISLFDIKELRRLFHISRAEFVLAIACAFGVALIGVLEGIVIAIALSAIYIFRRAWAPYSAVLGKLEDTPGFHDISRHPGAVQEPGLLIVRWSAPLFFANANLFRDRIRELVAVAPEKPRWVLVAAEPIADIDTTAGSMLHDLDLELNAADIRFAFAELQSSVADKIVRLGLLEVIDAGHIYPSVTEGLKAFRLETGADEAEEN